MKPTIAVQLCLIVLAAWVAPARAFEDVGVHPSCVICGMDREHFGYSRMLVEFGDGSAYGTCSLRCAAWILQAEGEERLRSVRVADYGTRALVPAEEATWVVGGTKPGVMTGVPKWAFRDRNDAERFLRESGGALSTYREALREALKELE